MNIENSIIFNFMEKKPAEPEEGGACPSCGDGVLKFSAPENCSCHISPPCMACINVPLVCKTCRTEFEP